MYAPFRYYALSRNLILPQIPSDALTCPEDDVTLWEWCTFSFVEPILNLATIHTLNGKDIWTLSPFFRHKNLFKKCLEYRRQCVYLTSP